MSLIKFLLFISFSLFYAVISTAQKISSKILDSESNKPLALVNVVWEKGKGVTTDTNGEFSFYLPQKYSYGKLVQFSLIGYHTKQLSIREIKNSSTIYLKAKPFALKNVLISDEKITAETILDSVVENLEINHKEDQFKKRRLFFKETNNSNVGNFVFDLKKSSIKELTPEFIEETLKQMPEKSSFLSEVLVDRFGDLKKQKIFILKANKLYDVNGNGAMEAFYNKLENVLNRNVKEDSYYKIKTGIIGFKMQADSTFIKNGQVMDFRNEMGSKDQQENFFLYNRKEVLDDVFSDIFLRKDSKIKFLKNRNDFDFVFEEDDILFIGSEEVYRLRVKSKGSNKFNGTLYVNSSDFGIMRMDYENNKNLRSMKLLGVNYKETGYRGSIVFNRESTNNYELAYIERTIENSFGVDRPFKIVEKNKHVRGRRKQNELKFNMQMQMSLENKYQVLVLNSNPTTIAKYDNVNEKASVQPKNWTKYEDDFWDGHPKVLSFNSKVTQLKELAGSY